MSDFGPGVLRTESGRTYLIDEAIGLAPEPGTPCDAAESGHAPTINARTGECRCTVCPRCRHHTGNAHQGHYWASCSVTGTDRGFHLCCPGNCELEAPDAG